MDPILSEDAVLILKFISRWYQTVFTKDKIESTGEKSLVIS